MLTSLKVKAMISVDAASPILVTASMAQFDHNGMGKTNSPDASRLGFGA